MKRSINQAASSGSYYPDSYQMKYATFLGDMRVVANNQGIVASCLPNERKIELADIPGATREQSKLYAVLLEAGYQINQFLSNNRKEFDLPLFWGHMSEFQQKVLRATYSIPYGKTRSYGEIASQAHSPSAYQAVGSALARNPIPLFIPCHRVIRSDGTLGGFGGKSQQLSLKQKLLDHEQKC